VQIFQLGPLSGQTIFTCQIPTLSTFHYNFNISLRSCIFLKEFIISASYSKHVLFFEFPMMTLNQCQNCVGLLFWGSVHCKPSKANTRLKTTTCETGPGTTRINSLEICVWSLLILEIDDGWYFPNSIYDSSTCYFVICTLNSSSI
jgi:hypothetical protein